MIKLIFFAINPSRTKLQKPDILS